MNLILTLVTTTLFTKGNISLFSNTFTEFVKSIFSSEEQPIKNKKQKIKKALLYIRLINFTY